MFNSLENCDLICHAFLEETDKCLGRKYGKETDE